MASSFYRRHWRLVAMRQAAMQIATMVAIAWRRDFASSSTFWRDLMVVLTSMAQNDANTMMSKPPRASFFMQTRRDTACM